MADFGFLLVNSFKYSTAPFTYLTLCLQYGPGKELPVAAELMILQPFGNIPGSFIELWQFLR